MPAQKISPFLWFDHQAEAAARFYVSVFKGKVKEIARYPEGAPGPAGTVMTVDFELFGQPFTALNGGPLFQFNESISFVVHCKTQREVDTYWKKLLSGGGKPSQCGWLKDKYGVSWQIVPEVLFKLCRGKDKARTQRVFSAMLQMVKLDIKGLEAAAKQKS
jgi:predicted 3-demethylubiquinone-9 3-methyltransferase (glyoxalase superfamily)